MNRRRGILVLTVLVTLLVLLWFEPTHVIRGWLRGEAFYQGRPTSYWSAELKRWQSSELWLGGVIEARPAFIVNQLGEVNFEVGAIRGGGITLYERQLGLFDKLAERVGWPLEHPARPALLNDDPAAEPVLRELLNDPSEVVRNHARTGLLRFNLHVFPAPIP